MPERLTLFVAAEKREFDGILQIVSPHPLHWGLQFACEAEFNGSIAVFVANGPGVDLAGAAADAVRQRVKPDTVVSTGFCGALDRDLNLGDILIATSVLDIGNGRMYPALQPRESAQVRSGAVVCSPRVAVTRDEKRELRATGAVAVEMEASAIASRAHQWRAGFYCIRAVTDLADQDFPVDFNRMRDRAGRFSRSRIAAAAIARPWSRIPGLIGLERGCRAASRSLGEFFANCTL